MFEQTFVDTRVQPRKPAAVAGSALLQCAAVGGLLLVPLLHIESLPLPKPEGPAIWMIQTKPPAPPPPESVVRRRPTRAFTSLLTGPTRVPDSITTVIDEPDA